jgi:hypothetical protein
MYLEAHRHFVVVLRPRSLDVARVVVVVHRRQQQPAAGRRSEGRIGDHNVHGPRVFFEVRSFEE